MATTVHTKVEIFLPYPVNQELITQYYLKFQILHSLVIRDYRATTLILKLDAKYSIFVLTISNMIFCALTEQYSINNTLYVFGGISLIVRPLKVFMA